MAENKDRFDTDSGRGLSSDPVEVDIPLLRKQQKERKGGAVPFAGGAGAGQGAAAGGGAAASAAGGGLKALLTGKIGVAAAALGLGGAGLVGYGLWQQGGSQRAARANRLELGAISSSINARKRDSQGSKSLAYMAKAGAGQLKWDDPQAAKKNAPAPQEKVEAAQEPAEKNSTVPDADEMMREMMQRAGDDGAKNKGLGRMAGAKLSSGLGQSGAFGKNNIFSGGSGFNMKDMKDMKKLGSNKIRNKRIARGRVGAMRRGAKNRLAKRINTRGIKASRAMGQLKFSQNRSHAAAQVGNSAAGAAGYAADAFSQSNTTGGDPTGGGGDFPEIEAPGGGAPDVTAGGGGGSTPNFSNCPDGYIPDAQGGCLQGGNQTGYQNLLNNAGDMKSNATQLKIAAAILLAAAIAAFIAGGWWILLGVILLGIAMMLFSTASSMNAQADMMGQQVANQYGQQEQADIVAGSEDGQGSDVNLRDHSNTVADDVREEQDATYEEK